MGVRKLVIVDAESSGEILPVDETKYEYIERVIKERKGAF